MTTPPRRQPPQPNRRLRDAQLPDPVERTDQLQLRRGVVVAAATPAAPALWTADVRLADGTVVAGVYLARGYTPVVDDVVDLLVQGPLVRVLGPLAQAASTPPAPPAPPPAPPSIRTATVLPTGSGSHRGSFGWANVEVYQGGTQPAIGLWVYGSGVATAKGAGTIVAGTVYVRRLNTSHGVGGAANVRLGTHAYGSIPGGAPAGHSHVAVVGQLGRGQALQLPLTADQLASLNAGAPGVGLMYGVLGTSSPDYLIASAPSGGDQPDAASGTLVLTVQD